MPNQPQVLVMAASTRSGSVNRALAARIAVAVEASGAKVTLLDLADYEMPIYNGDVEAADGVPEAAKRLVELVGEASALVIVSPEYNGAFPPLLKNTIDWMTRIDMRMLAPVTVGLASASPGGGGGARALALIRLWMANMRVTVLEEQVVVPNATLNDDGALVGIDEGELGALVAAVCAAERVAEEA